MTNEEWKEVEDSLCGVFGRASLVVDGFQVDIVKEPYDSMKNVIVVYIDGKWRGEWLTNDCEIRRRFFQRHTRNLLSIKDQKRLKRERKAVREAVGKTTYDWYSPYWTSFRSMKSHFVKNNKSIELAKTKQE